MQVAVVRNSTPGGRDTLSRLLAFPRQRLKDPRTVERAFRWIADVAAEGTGGATATVPSTPLLERQLLVAGLQRRVDQMVSDAQTTTVFAAPYEPHAHRLYRNQKTGRFHVETVGVPDLEEAFILSALALVENNPELLAFCQNKHCRRIFVRTRSTKNFCGDGCRWAHRDQSNPAAAAARKRNSYTRKTPVGSKRGRPRKYPAVDPREPNSQGNGEGLDAAR